MKILAKLTIIDTGFNTEDRDGTPNSGDTITNLETYRAKNGTAITLHNTVLRMRSGANISDEPNPNSNEPARIHFTSFSNRIFELDFIINVRDSDHRSDLKEICVLDKTSGIKILFPSGTDDNIKTLIEIIGRNDTKFNTSDFAGSNPLIVGRVIGVSVNQVSTSRKFQIIGTITFEEGRAVSST